VHDDERRRERNKKGRAVHHSLSRWIARLAAAAADADADADDPF